MGRPQNPSAQAGIVVIDHDLTGIVVGVTLFEPLVTCGVTIGDWTGEVDTGQECSDVTRRGLRVSGGGGHESASSKGVLSWKCLK